MTDELRNRMADFYGVAPAQLLPVRGAAHGADLLMRRLALDGRRRVVTTTPAMRAIAAANGLQADALAARTPSAREARGGRGGADVDAILLQSPDIEMGDILDTDEIAQLVRQAPQALIVIDESLIDLTDAPSFAENATGRIVVLRSVDKAFGLAGDPCGALIASPEAVETLEPLLALDPLPGSVAKRALGALDPRMTPVFEERRRRTIAERKRMTEALQRASFAAAIAGPFVLVDVADADAALAACRRFGAAAARLDEKRLRLDVGGPDANDLALAALGAGPSAPRRRAETRRETLETKIAVAIDLDTEGPSAISTGVGFYDHMLAQVAAHGGFALFLHCAGDTHIDAHHTIEDCALAFGAALKEALGERRGVARYGFTLPMDEAKAEAAIDLGGRPFLVFDGAFSASHIGQYPTEMTEHVFRSIADSLGAAIHISVKGENDHHKTEACFKAFGRALRQAARREGDATPSTKGVIL